MTGQKKRAKNREKPRLTSPLPLLESNVSPPDKKEKIWSNTLQLLRPSMTAATFDTLLATSRLIDIRDADPEIYVVEVDSSLSVDWLEHRLKEIIIRMLMKVIGKLVRIEFVTKAYVPDVSLEEEVFEASADDTNRPDLEFVAAYYDARNALIQPQRVEVHTQYFRLKWRKLLGPLLSELVRELRQRCHYQSGRNTTRVTYRELSKTLGVSIPTIERALARDKNGRFKNEYLHYFIKEMQPIRRRIDGGRVQGIGTRFVIYLDEPLTPQDEAKLHRTLRELSSKNTDPSK